MITAIVWLVWAVIGALYNETGFATSLIERPGNLLARALFVLGMATAAAILATVVVNR